MSIVHYQGEVDWGHQAVIGHKACRLWADRSFLIAWTGRCCVIGLEFIGIICWISLCASLKTVSVIHCYLIRCIIWYIFSVIKEMLINYFSHIWLSEVIMTQHLFKGISLEKVMSFYLFYCRTTHSRIPWITLVLSSHHTPSISWYIQDAYPWISACSSPHAYPFIQVGISFKLLGMKTLNSIN